MKALTLLLSLLPIPTAEACSCMSMGDTGAEIAQSVRDSDSFVFVGRVLNETSYTAVAPYPSEFQNVTFSLDETLVEITKSLPSYVVVGDDGTTTVETHTETTCCLCGRSLSGDDVGAEYLISIYGRGTGSLSSCSVNCRTDTEYCAEIVTALQDTKLGAGTGKEDPPLVSEGGGTSDILGESGGNDAETETGSSDGGGSFEVGGDPELVHEGVDEVEGASDMSEETAGNTEGEGSDPDISAGEVAVAGPSDVPEETAGQEAESGFNGSSVSDPDVSDVGPSEGESISDMPAETAGQEAETDGPIEAGNGNSSGTSDEGMEDMDGDEGVDEELEGSNVSSAACAFMKWLLVLPWPLILS